MNNPPLRRSRGLPHRSHWAPSPIAERRGIEVVRYRKTLLLSALLGNILASVSHPARIAIAMVRRGWLDHDLGPEDRRGPRRIRRAVEGSGA
jgi:hypothetical protein